MRSVIKVRLISMCSTAAMTAVLGFGGAAFAGDPKYSAPHLKPGGAFPTAEEVGGDVFLEPLAPGTEIPKDIPLVGVDGKKTTIGEILPGDKPVVLNFMLMFNPQSIDETKSLQELAKRNPNVSVVGINIGGVGGKLMPGSPQSSVERTMGVVMKDAGITYPVYADWQSWTVQSFGLRNAPTTFLLDKNGKVVKVFQGPQLWTSTQRMADVAKLVE